MRCFNINFLLNCRHLFLRRSLSTVAPITLRPYQEECLSACLDALDSGRNRLGVSLPTGAGKTTVFITLLSRLAAVNADATRSLIIVNTVELARQSALQAQALFPKWTVEIEQGAKHIASGSADLTIATYQTLASPERIRKFDPKHLKAIIVDEAHHAAAPSYRRILSHFHAEIKHPDEQFQPPDISHAIPIIGFSATFSRHDGLRLGSVFDHIVYHRDFLQMIKEEWLCGVRFTSVRANINLANVTVSSATGDFNPTSLSQVIDTETINKLVVQSWLERAADRKSTLVFCVNRAHVQNLTDTFREFGIDARSLDSKTPVLERKNLISSFKAGEYPILINCAILTEGADIPNIDCVILARPTRSRNIFAQMMGRGMRQSPNTGKIDCRIVDFVDSHARMPGVVCTPSLFGLDPGEVQIDDLSIEDLERKISDGNLSKPTDIPDPTFVTYTDHDNPFSLVHESSGAPHILQLSANAWVGCGGEVYVLECMGKGHIRISLVPQKDGVDTHYQAHYTQTIDKATAAALKIAPYLHNRKVLTANTLDNAIKGCDTFVKHKVVPGGLAMGLLRSARWRKMPATEQQKALVAKRWGTFIDVQTAKANALLLQNMTKGEAANIITRLKHGAQARYQKATEAAMRAEKTSKKEAERKDRERVTVGPLRL